MSQLGKLISVEKLFLQELEQHADQLRAALANIEEYTSQVIRLGHSLSEISSGELLGQLSYVIKTQLKAQNIPY